MTPPTETRTDRVQRIVVGITGASGAIYSVRLLQKLAASRVEVHLTISPSGAAVIEQELGLRLSLANPDLSKLFEYTAPWTDGEVASIHSDDLVHYHRFDDFMTPIASGSFKTDAMVVCPCSGTTLSNIARAAGSNLIGRAAEVHLKEHRKLVLVPRETPLSVIQIENMHRVAQAGGVILPAMPGWYHGVESLDDIVNFVVSRIMDQIDVSNALISRWKDDA